MSVTYIFGAGASAQKVPVVKDMPERLVRFYFTLRDEAHGSPDPGRAKEPLLEDVGHLIDALVEIRPTKITGKDWRNKPVENPMNLDGWEYSPRHASIDTYAKKLFIRDDPWFVKLKILTALFFYFEQWGDRVDNRYDSFFASIIKRRAKELPDNIRIISWNYDSQFEFAYQAFSGDPNRLNNQMALGMLTKRYTLPKAAALPEPSQMKGTLFSIFKINGTAGFYDDVNHIEKFPWENSNNLFEGLFKSYTMATNEKYKLVPSLSFAWEASQFFQGGKSTIIDLARNSVKNARTLVVIGYSVPFFNREIDKDLFGAMKPNRVYVQDKDPEGIIQRLRGIDSEPEIPPNKYIPIHDIGQFYLPNELIL